MNLGDGGMELSDDALDERILGPLLVHLRRREAAIKWAVAALLFFGLPATFFGPFILTCLYWALAFTWGRYLPWTWMFAGSCLVLIPLLFRTEWKTKGSYFTDAVRSSFNRDPLPWVGPADVDVLLQFVRNPRTPAIGFVELFLWGPRQVLDAVDKIVHMRLLRSASRLRAAGMLAALLKIDHADIGQLKGHGQKAAEALTAVSYCAWFGWIGVSKDGQRVWLESDSRELLSR